MTTYEELTKRYEEIEAQGRRLDEQGRKLLLQGFFYIPLSFLLGSIAGTLLGYVLWGGN